MKCQKWFSLCWSGVLLAACHEATAPEPGAETPDGAASETLTPLAASNTWSTKRPMLYADANGVAGTINGIIYVIGPGSTLQAYNVATNTWSTRRSLPVLNTFINGINGASVINGRLYVSGGDTSPKALFVYNPATNAWTRKADMPSGGAYGAQGVIGGQLYVYFGHTYTGRKFFRYNPATNTWATLPKPPWAHGHPAAGVINGKFYLAGGEEDYLLHGVLDVYNASTNQWTTKAPLPVELEGMASAVINGKLYLAGGERTWPNGIVATLRVYDPVTNQWTVKAPMPTARGWAAGAVATGKFFVMGGANATSLLRKVEVYTP